MVGVVVRPRRWRRVGCQLVGLVGAGGSRPPGPFRVSCRRAEMPAATELQGFAPPDHEDFSCWRPIVGRPALRLAASDGVAFGVACGDSPEFVLPAGALVGLGLVLELVGPARAL